MKLFYSRGACSLSVRIMLHELKLQCEYEAVDLKTKVTETGMNYLEINPKGSVSALQLDNHEVLTENAAILQYLADTYQNYHTLPPVGNMQRYRTLEWLNFITTDLHKNAGALLTGLFSDEIKESIFKPTLNKKLAIVEAGLQHNKFLFADYFTVADCYLFVILSWLAKIKFPMQAYPAISRYFNEALKYPAVQAALEEEKITELALAE